MSSTCCQPDEWPDGVQRASRTSTGHLRVHAGPSELGISADAKLARSDRFEDLATIEVPTLVIGAEHDTMDPRHMEAMAAKLPHGEYLYCPQGSHLAMYDDQQVYFDGMIAFVNKLRNGG
jgi:proline iminopeptidase